MKIEYLVVADMKTGTNVTVYTEGQFKKAVEDFKELKDKTDIDVELKMRIVTVHKDSVLANRGNPDLPF